MVVFFVFASSISILNGSEKRESAVFKRVLAQVVLLDVNSAAGESFKEALDKEFGPENALFFKCDVESEAQIKGDAQGQLPRL